MSDLVKALILEKSRAEFKDQQTIKVHQVQISILDEKVLKLELKLNLLQEELNARDQKEKLLPDHDKH